MRLAFSDQSLNRFILYKMATVELITALAVIVLTIWYWWRRSKSPLNALPGPKGLPFIGNLLQLNKKRSDLTIVQWTKEYGPIYKMKMFSKTWVVVGSYDEMYEVMVTKGRIYGGRAKSFRVGTITFNYKDVLFSSITLPHWHALKKAAFRAVRQHGDGLNRIEAILLEMTQELIDKVKQYGGKPVDLKDGIYNYIVKTVYIMIVGIRPDENDETFRQTVKFEKLLAPSFGPANGRVLNIFPWIRFFGHSTFKTLLKICNYRDIICEGMWKQSEETYSPDEEPVCAINAIRRLVDKRSKYFDPQIDIEHAKGLLIDLVGASVITTVNFAYALPNILINYPDVQRRLREEVDHVATSEKRTLSIFDRDAMPYTTATILELLRHNSMAPAFPHVAIEHTTLGNYNIPSETIVFVLFSAFHHDEKFWGDPFVFRPERFLDKDGKLVPPDHPNRKHVLQFGAALRVCMGEIFALRRLFMFVARLVQAFSLEPAKELVTSDPREYNSGTILSQKSYTVKLIKRNNE